MLAKAFNAGKIKILSWYGTKFYSKGAVVEVYRNMILNRNPDISNDMLNSLVKEYEDELNKI